MTNVAKAWGRDNRDARCGEIIVQKRHRSFRFVEIETNNGFENAENIRGARSS